ncbi:unnamed protein product [Meganyctiphanes norvegica]|uniref:Condensation domain-containing protein n=1 Tax=Meganyctiphanes norvegica TaxID=48144 RepID=A0AAV2RLF9_MEGNR
MSATENGGEWVRPATDSEFFADIMNQNRFMVSSYCLTLNAKAPLQQGHILQALGHLYRQVPTLRLCLQQRDGGPFWWREMQNMNIDFQVLEKPDVQSEHIKMATHHYNSSCGPLWCVRLLPTSNSVQCPIEEVSKDFPFQYYLIFGFHHGITDGTSNMMIVGQFIKLINSVINGDVINDETQLGHHDDGSQTIKQKEQKNKEFNENPEYKEKKVREFESLKKLPFLLRAYPPEEGVTPCTLTITYDLDKDSTNRFLTRCKAEGVSVHSGFCAMANAAIVEIVEGKGIKEDVYDLTLMHTVNMRRYWTGESSKALGMHLGTLMQRTLTPNKLTHDLWSYARSIHKDIHSNLVSGQVFEDNALLMNDAQKNKGGKPFENIPTPWMEYSTSNMGNLDKSIPGEMPHVQMTHIMRTTSNHKFGSTVSHMMQSFRGRFLYGCDYCPNQVSTQTATCFVNKIFEILKKNI